MTVCTCICYTPNALAIGMHRSSADSLYKERFNVVVDRVKETMDKEGSLLFKGFQKRKKGMKENSGTSSLYRAWYHLFGCPKDAVVCSFNKPGFWFMSLAAVGMSGWFRMLRRLFFPVVAGRLASLLLVLVGFVSRTRCWGMAAEAET